MNFKLSVIVCTHNPRDNYFSRVIDGLRAQSLGWENWELLVVDNCSAEPVSSRYDFSWHPHSRFISEKKLGLTPARLCGVREACGDLLVFVDDDNVLNEDFLETALRVVRKRPFLGSWSGQCRPEFEIEPPEWTRHYWGNLAIREFGADVWSNLPRLPESMPCGAGLCVKRDVAQHYLYLHETGERSFQFDRAGGSLLSGGDNDLAACACDLGLGVGLISSLKLTHLIPPERMTEDYLERLAEGISFSSTLLDAIYGNSPTRRSVIGKTADFLRFIRLRPPHRGILKAVYRGRARAVQLFENAHLTET